MPHAQLDNEGRRVSIYEKQAEKSPLFARSLSTPVRAGSLKGFLGVKIHAKITETKWLGR